MAPSCLGQDFKPKQETLAPHLASMDLHLQAFDLGGWRWGEGAGGGRDGGGGGVVIATQSCKKGTKRTGLRLVDLPA